VKFLLLSVVCFARICKGQFTLVTLVHIPVFYFDVLHLHTAQKRPFVPCFFSYLSRCLSPTYLFIISYGYPTCQGLMILSIIVLPLLLPTYMLCSELYSLCAFLSMCVPTS
jgi:hypothetical protein